MPSKRRRVASRQAELSQRKRRSRNRAAQTDVPARPTTSPSPASTEGQGDQIEGGAQAAAAPRPATIPAQPRQASRQSRAGRRRTPARVEPLPTYSRLGSELRRIGAITFVIVVLLGILTAVLR